MKISGLHILLTYQCTYECDHCFVWGSPRQSGVMTLAQVNEVLHQARVSEIDWIYFEGGEPALYYATLLASARAAKKAGFHVGIVSNAYWAISYADAEEFLRPFAGLLDDLSISNDHYHFSDVQNRQAGNATAAAEHSGIPVGEIRVAQPEDMNSLVTGGPLPDNSSVVMYRGRASKCLVSRATLSPWETFTNCPHEDLREPGRCHLDPLGNLHVCQGISIGNIFQTPLVEICDGYDADRHPICGPLLRGGPAELVHEYHIEHKDSYADACHLCYEARLSLHSTFPECLRPNQMYGCEG